MVRFDEVMDDESGVDEGEEDVGVEDERARCAWGCRGWGLGGPSGKLYGVFRGHFMDMISNLC